ncbi:MAG: methyltransferase domain-containing protein [Thiolinea sp.]
MNEVALLDCRPFAEYCLGHVKGACSLPATELFARMHELPQRHHILHLCGKTDDLKLAADYLLERGHTVAEHTIWTTDLHQQLATGGRLETGPTSAQLWQPAPLWKRFVMEIMPAHNISAGKGLDIACGAGRDMVYLAQQGWEMTGVDRSADSLQRVATLVQHSKLKVRTLQRDLENTPDPFADFPDGSFDLICVARYLHRPLFPVIRRLLASGGVLLYQTFMQGCEQTAVGRPRNPDFLLRPGELAAEFADAEIILDQIETLDDGRPVAAFVARKR